MLNPNKLEFDVIQSENFVEESYPGAGDGKGWRLNKNGDFQIGAATQLNGEIFSPEGNLRIDRRATDKPGFVLCDDLNEAMITPLKIGDGQIRTDRVKTEGTVTDMSFELTVSGEGPLDPAVQQKLSAAVRETVISVLKASCVTGGLVSQCIRAGAVVAQEAAARADADAALASRIRGLDLGKEYLYVKQPGGPVEIGDLQKCCGRDTFTEQFLNREVRSDLKPEVVCALSMAAPITTNGKPPLNILPEEVDDCK